jgi:hypothetical protein
MTHPIGGSKLGENNMKIFRVGNLHKQLPEGSIGYIFHWRKRKSRLWQVFPEIVHEARLKLDGKCNKIGKIMLA